MMLACTETITVVQYSYDAENDMDSYTCTTIEGVSWYGKLVAAVENKGLTGETKVTVRIPETNMPDITIKRGDFIVHGVVETIEKQADLNGLEYFTVLSVGDNRRGKRRRHWVVSGA